MRVRTRYNATAAAMLAAAMVFTPTLRAGAERDSAPDRWSWPTAPPGPLVEAFAAPADPYSAGHRGIDLAAAAGELVLAPAAATVVFSGVVVDRPVVTLRVGEHVLVSLEPVVSELPLGAQLTAGQPVGSVARGGHCDGRCLHLGVRVDGSYVSPLLYLASVPPAVLLPLG